MSTYWMAQGITSQYSVVTYVGKNLQKSRYMCMYNRFTLLYCRNWYNLVNQLYNKNYI